MSSFLIPKEAFTIIFHNIVPYGYVVIILLAVFVISIYLKLAITGPTEVKKTSLPIAIGFILQVVALFITSTGDIIGHFIGLGGIVLIFLGLVRMRWFLIHPRPLNFS